MQNSQHYDDYNYDDDDDDDDDNGDDDDNDETFFPQDYLTWWFLTHVWLL